MMYSSRREEKERGKKVGEKGGEEKNSTVKKKELKIWLSVKNYDCLL